MAFNDKHRVTKDTSARKNATSSGTVPALEVTAIRASYDAYITSIKASHEEIIENLHSDHAENLTAVKAQHAEEVEEINSRLAKQQQEHQSKVGEETGKALNYERSKWAESTRELDEQIEKLRAENACLRRTNESEREMSVKTLAIARDETARVNDKLTDLRARANEKVKELRTELQVGPNSWFEITFMGKRLKDRTCIKRPSETMEKVFGEVAKTLSEDASEYELEHNAKLIPDRDMTLQQVSAQNRKVGSLVLMDSLVSKMLTCPEQLGIKSGDVIRVMVKQGP